MNNPEELYTWSTTYCLWALLLPRRYTWADYRYLAPLPTVYQLADQEATRHRLY